MTGQEQKLRKLIKEAILKEFDADTYIDKLREAQDKLYDVIDILKDVASDTHNQEAKDYIIAHLKTMVSSEHGYLSSTYNIDEWIEDIENGKY